MWIRTAGRVAARHNIVLGRPERLRHFWEALNPKDEIVELRTRRRWIMKEVVSMAKIAVKGRRTHFDLSEDPRVWQVLELVDVKRVISEELGC